MYELIWYESLMAKKMKTHTIVFISRRLCKHILFKSSIAQTNNRWYLIHPSYCIDEGSGFTVSGISPQSILNTSGGTCLITKGRIIK